MGYLGWPRVEYGALLHLKTVMEVDLARPGSIMVHFGTSRRSMEVDVARPGSIMVRFGNSRRSMEVDLARPGSIMQHFGTSRL